MTPINHLTSILAALLLSVSFTTAQEKQSGMPGDNFSLEGALELFKTAESPEHFEELLNKEDGQVNNLDLNEDGDIDYIRVIDHLEEDAHAITLQVPIGKNDAQDIAVIAIEKTGQDNATLQIIGDEEIYGEEVIIEPFGEVGSSDGKGGPSAEYTVSRVVVNVWFWPSVRYMYRPTYRAYVSPFSWGYYPGWWRPWKPLSWAFYGPRVSTWRIGYRVTPTLRLTRARRIYTPRRTTSVTVVNRYKVNKTNYVAKRKTVRTTKGIKTSSTNNKSIVTKSNRKVIAKDGNRKTVVDKTSRKAVATDGNKKAVVDRSTSQAVGTNGKTKVARKKKTKTTKVKSKNGKKAVKKTKVKKKKVKKKKN
tara:strand:+ start:1823 stop:2911 length:1089 start_codon:yes stop_codon:yes gene_type:complete